MEGCCGLVGGACRCLLRLAAAFSGMDACCGVATALSDVDALNLVSALVGLPCIHVHICHNPTSPPIPGFRRVPHAAADELDELSLDVTANQAAGEGEGGEGPTAEQRRRGEEAAHSLLPLLEPLLEQLLERCRQK